MKWNMRPIDADKLIECINIVQEWALVIGGDLDAIEPVNEGFISLINSMPTIEAEPVRHGHWIDIDCQLYTWKVRCSKCGYERSMMSTQGKYPAYCEECGAKMDEVKEE